MSSEGKYVKKFGLYNNLFLCPQSLIGGAELGRESGSRRLWGRSEQEEIHDDQSWVWIIKKEIQALSPSPIYVSHK